MKHRDAADSKRYRMLAAKFIDKYGIDTKMCIRDRSETAESKCVAKYYACGIWVSG